MNNNINIIKNLYELFAERDLEGIRDIFSTNIIWRQMEGFPRGGIYNGPDAIFENVFKGFKENWTDWTTIKDEYKAVDDLVLVFGRYTGVYNQTNNSVSAEFVHVYKIADQKIVEFTQYTDTKLVADAMTPSQEKATLNNS